MKKIKVVLRICGNHSEERSAFKLVVDERRRQVSVFEADSAPHRTLRQFPFDSIFTSDDFQVKKLGYFITNLLIL